MTTAHLSESPSFPLSTSSPLADIAAMISVPVGFDDRFPTEWSTPEPVSADECFVFSDSAADPTRWTVMASRSTLVSLAS
jgi:hypothetical protein